MGPKLLFITGIVVAHGALAASFARQEAPKHRNPISTCVQTPEELPYFEPPRELLASADIPVADLKVPQP